ncbi:MAG: RES domain-containing protein [Chitinophagales bacterium]|nr:RES domain-containing protein [Chitinophagales bacterium]
MHKINGIKGVNMFCRVMKDLCKRGEYNEIKSSFISSQQIFYKTFISKGKTLYRCRIHTETDIGKKFKLFKDVGYNRDSSKVKLGRCNEKGQGVFYCSENIWAAFLETKPLLKKPEPIIATITEWTAESDIEMRFVIQPFPSKRIHPYENDLGKLYDAEMIEVEREEKITTDLYFEFINDLMGSKGEEHYLITTAYANIAFTNSNGLVYRSVVDVDSYNVVFKKDVEDMGLIKLTNAKWVSILPQKVESPLETDYDIDEKYCKEINQEEKLIVW